MNEQIVNHMINTLKRSFMIIGSICIFQSFSFSQTSNWEEAEYIFKVIDRKMSKKILSEWIDIRSESASDGIQKDDGPMIVCLNTDNGKFTISHIVVDRGEYIELDMDLVKEKMDPVLIQELLDRRYKWDDHNYEAKLLKMNDITGKGPLNIFRSRNNKIARDHFWWAYRQFNVNVANSVIFRFKNYPVGITFETGDADIGYPSNFSHSISLGICNELVKGQFIIPMKPFIALNDYHPIEGGYGLGLKFDSHLFGGSIVYKNPNWINMSETYFTDTSNVVLTNWYSTIYISRSMGIPAQKLFGMELLGESTMRVKFGIGFHQILYGQSNSDENDFTVLDQTNTYESFLIPMRIEWISNENKWKTAIQTTWNPAGHIGFNTYTSYAFTKLFRVGLTMGYNNPKEFECNNENKTYKWEPGFIISPEISFIIG